MQARELLERLKQDGERKGEELADGERRLRRQCMSTAVAAGAHVGAAQRRVRYYEEQIEGSAARRRELELERVRLSQVQICGRWLSV